MRKVWLLALGLFLFFGTAGAVDKKGKVGIGFFNDDAPLGARYWVTERIGFDVGFGLNLRNVVDSTQDTNLLTSNQDPSKKSLVDFRFDAGLPVNLVRTEKVNFLIRPGVSFQGVPFFNQIFKDSFQQKIVVDSVFPNPNDTTKNIVRYDTLQIPFGSVLDTITEEKSKSFDINVTLGIEYFPVENFSVSLFHGVGARTEKKTKNGKSSWAITSRPFFKGTNLGFRYYF
ncbi:MAG: hypothetical protein L0Z48_08685 [candidate division Zixibacteria bacterium]|nr:hypothetical protein [candidate division Zixibacteria bacterium]MCI0596601.1 hypothetical protein [candidate division Zixibacteria bacterium]